MLPRDEETRALASLRGAPGLAREVGTHSNPRVGRAGSSRNEAANQVQRAGRTGRADEMIE